MTTATPSGVISHNIASAWRFSPITVPSAITQPSPTIAFEMRQPRPILAFGNSDGDLQMLQYTMAGTGPRLALYVHHDDAEREYAYDRNSQIGKLDKGLDEARAKSWPVISMKRDWKTALSAQQRLENLA